MLKKPDRVLPMKVYRIIKHTHIFSNDFEKYLFRDEQLRHDHGTYHRCCPTQAAMELPNLSLCLLLLLSKL